MKKKTVSNKAPLSLTKKTLSKESIEAIRKANTEEGAAKLEYANLCVHERQVGMQMQSIVTAKEEAMAKIIAAKASLSQAATDASRSVGIDPNAAEQWTIQIDAGTIERVG